MLKAIAYSIRKNMPEEEQCFEVAVIKPDSENEDDLRSAT